MVDEFGSVEQSDANAPGSTEDIDVLVRIAESCGLDGAAARHHLETTVDVGTAIIKKKDKEAKMMGSTCDADVPDATCRFD